MGYVFGDRGLTGFSTREFKETEMSMILHQIGEVLGLSEPYDIREIVQIVTDLQQSVATKTRTHKGEYTTARIVESQESKDRVFNAVLDFMEKEEIYTGEEAAQCDATFIVWPEVLYEILDEILKPEVSYDE